MILAPHLYLASQSPRRRELLHQIGVCHTVVNVAVAEFPQANESPRDYVQRLAAEKSRAGVCALGERALPLLPVLGADTLVVCDGLIMEKPCNADDCASMLRRLSGRNHQVLTAVALSDTDRTEVMLSVTEVTFRPLSEAEISAYWQTGEPQDKAGGYGIQGLGAVFVQELHGSYSGVVGLPIEATVELLRIFGVPWWQSVKDHPHE